MIYYVELNEISSASGGKFPHIEMKRISFEEAIKILSKKMIGGSQRRMPKYIMPKVITNDSQLSFTYRQAFNFDEFKKWCGLKLNQNFDREYYPNFKLISKEIGEDIFSHFVGIVENRFSEANMIKGQDESSFTDEYGQTFYSNTFTFNHGWETKKINSSYLDVQEIYNYEWWNNLDKNWKKFLSRFLVDSLDDDNERLSFDDYKSLINDSFIPSPSKLTSLLKRESLSFSNSEIKDIDLIYIERFTNLKKLDLSFIKNVENISSLGKLTNLSELDISYTEIDNLEFIKNLHQLNRLKIVRTNISDLLPLYALNNLEYLDFSYSQSIERLTPIKNLKTIKLEGTKFNYSDILEFEKLIGYKLNIEK